MTGFYRPPENHIGVIYRFGRFRRLIAPDQLTFLLFGKVCKEVSMDMRTAIVPLKDVLTRDQILVDLELKVFFYVDLRQTEPARLLQAVRFNSDDAFEQVVKTNTNDVVRNVVFSSRDFAELNTVRGRAWLKENLSREIGERVRGFGIIIGTYGVNIAGFQPNANFITALKERSAAMTQGQAEFDRIQPTLSATQNLNRESAIVNLMLQLAAAISKTGQVPEIVFPDSNASVNLGDSTDRRSSNRPRTPNPLRPLGGLASD